MLFAPLEADQVADGENAAVRVAFVAFSDVAMLQHLCGFTRKISGI